MEELGLGLASGEPCVGITRAENANERAEGEELAFQLRTMGAADARDRPPVWLWLRPCPRLWPLRLLWLGGGGGGGRPRRARGDELVGDEAKLECRVVEALATRCRVASGGEEWDELAPDESTRVIAQPLRLSRCSRPSTAPSMWSPADPREPRWSTPSSLWAVRGVFHALGPLKPTPADDALPVERIELALTLRARKGLWSTRNG